MKNGGRQKHTKTWERKEKSFKRPTGRLYQRLTIRTLTLSKNNWEGEGVKGVKEGSFENKNTTNSLPGLPVPGPSPSAERTPSVTSATLYLRPPSSICNLHHPNFFYCPHPNKCLFQTDEKVLKKIQTRNPSTLIFVQKSLTACLI